MLRTLKRLGAGLSVLVVIAFTGAMVPSVAEAAGATCTGTYGNYFAGGGSWGNVSVYGAQAAVEYQNPDLCGDDGTTSKGWTSAWAMVNAAAVAGGGGCCWAQTGWYQAGPQNQWALLYGAGIFQFAQYTKKCSADNSCGAGVSGLVNWISGTNPSTTTPWTYDAYRDFTTGRLTMRVNGTKVLESGYDPYGTWVTAWGTQFLAETNYKSDDVPGSSGNHNNWTGVKYLNGSHVFAFMPASMMWPTTTADTSNWHSGYWSPSSGGRGIYTYSD
ncbi:hypothetical protein [Kineosporia sp. A_224]|uniref:hypothetical protein n=1 Tax=Kineosporia sp. A_224 TaxID=1962180 RepID=UPI000B4B3D5C|nr:hypothetical protein [Kineosporia sp. A_224]